MVFNYKLIKFISSFTLINNWVQSFKTI